MSKKILNIYNTFDKVESILLGSVDKSVIKFCDPEQENKLNDIFDKTSEELNIIQYVMEQRGIKVYRPGECKNIEVNTPYFTSKGMGMPLTPRDNILIMGDTLIETSSWRKERIFESYYYREVFLELQAKGAKWITMPLPRHDYESSWPVVNQDPIIDGAAVLRVGKDIFVSNGGAHNELGLTWLKTMFPEYRYHTTEKHFTGHMDAHICIVRPGLVYTNHDKEVLPPAFRNWDVIKTPSSHDKKKMSEHTLIDDKIQDDDREDTILSTNCLVLDQNTIMMPNTYRDHKDVIEQFDRHKVEIVFVPLTHQYFFGQGLTCMTQELYRQTDGIQDYF
jgi:N-dimethylarginine dimethylaminohydrolase